jgi:hypothetical protein
MMNLFLGYDRLTGAPVSLTPKMRAEHLLLLGATNTGKTTLMENMVRQDIDAGNGVLVLDPHGDLYERLLKYCCVKSSYLKRLYLINPSDDSRRIGINYFDMPGLDIDSRVRLMLNGLYKAFGQSPDETKVLLERWGKASLRALEPAGLTLAELYYLLVNPEFREAVLSRIKDPFVRAEWDYFSGLSSRDKDFHLLAILDRASRFAESQRTREIFGQTNSIDWLKVMSEGGIVLANLLPGRAPEDLMKIVGISLLHQVYANAKMRPKNDPRTKNFYVYVDEFSQLLTDDYAKALRELRGFGVHFLLSQQDLNDLKRADEHEILFNTVLNNTSVKIVFHLGNYNEALEMAKHLFGPTITGDEIKAEITQPIPHTYETTVSSRGTSDSESQGTQEIITPDGLVIRVASGGSSGHQSSVMESTTQRTEYTYEKIPVFRSLEESFHRGATDIMAQAIGEAEILYSAKEPSLPLRTVLPTDYRMRREHIFKKVQDVYDRMGLLPPARVSSLLANRIAGLIEVREAEFKEYDGDDIPPENPTDPKTP